MRTKSTTYIVLVVLAVIAALYLLAFLLQKAIAG